MTSGKPMAYPKRTTQLHSGMTCLFCPAPNKLLTSEPVVAASEIDDDKEHRRDTAYDIGSCQFHFSQMLDSYEESKPRGHSDKRMEHAPYGHTTNMMITNLYQSSNTNHKAVCPFSVRHELSAQPMNTLRQKTMRWLLLLSPCPNEI